MIEDATYHLGRNIAVVKTIFLTQNWHVGNDVDGRDITGNYDQPEKKKKKKSWEREATRWWIQNQNYCDEKKKKGKTRNQHMTKKTKKKEPIQQDNHVQ